MSDPFERGLVVGKFCPLHLGHELLVHRAQAQCRELVVLSYTQPGFAGYGSALREAWLRERFPQAACHVIDDAWLAARCAARGLAPAAVPPDDAPDDVHRRFVAWLLTDLLGTRVDAVFTSEGYGDGFAAVLQAHFGAPVQHVCVDRARSALPVSGTQLRRDPAAGRRFMAPEVYADLRPRIALLGGESTGKTTLAGALAQALGTAWVPEYGRELWEARRGDLRYDDMRHIARTQVARERQLAADTPGPLVCDTTPLTTRLYSEVMFGRVDDELALLAQRPYSLTLLCAPDFDFVQDGTRRDAAFRSAQQQAYTTALRQAGVAWATLEGPPGQRLARACALVRAAGL